MKLSRKIKDYMTSAPLIVDARASVEEANALMFEQALRHLPVQHDGRIVGILSDRDLSRVFSHKSAEAPRVEDVMTKLPFIVSPDEDIQRVTEVMASERLGSVLIKGPGDKLLGIFTTTDALALLSKIFAQTKPQEGVLTLSSGLLDQ